MRLAEWDQEQENERLRAKERRLSLNEKLLAIWRASGLIAPLQIEAEANGAVTASAFLAIISGAALASADVTLAIVRTLRPHLPLTQFELEFGPYMPRRRERPKPKKPMLVEQQSEPRSPFVCSTAICMEQADP